MSVELVFSPEATKAHDNDPIAKQCLNESITLAEKYMKTGAYVNGLAVIKADIDRFRQMLFTTEICYYNFKKYEEEEEAKTFTMDTESDGNGLSDEQKREAKELVAKWEEDRETNDEESAQGGDEKTGQPQSSANKVVNNTPLAWTKRRTGDHTKTIFINDTFINRIKGSDIKPSSNEWCVIVFAQALSIFHETGHLAFRWRGILVTPEQFGDEAGDNMEIRVFTFIFSILVFREPNEPWDPSQEIMGIGVHLNIESTVRRVTLPYIKKVYKSIFDTQQNYDQGFYLPITYTKGLHGYTGATPTKGVDEEQKPETSSKKYEMAGVFEVPSCGMKYLGRNLAKKFK